MLLLTLLLACRDKDANHDSGVPAWGLSERPANPDCLARPRPTEGLELSFDRVFSDLRFSSPVDLVQAPGDDSRWYVVEQAGEVQVFENREGVGSSDTFLDIRDRVESGGELGLLAIAFHPDYADNDEVYVSYTGEGMESRVSRFRTTDGGATLDPDTEEVLLRLEQPYSNHNGGNLEFGPDGYLYIAFGDGGSAGDPLETGQDPTDWFGSILRIDVDHGDPYEIPADNPFADGRDGAPEVYAYGLRNTWKMSFDRVTGELWAGDVGQNAVEEVDVIVNGGNYGWNLVEGDRCYAVDPCDFDGLIAPVATYRHSAGRSITGGYVYRGQALAALQGIYLYGDYSSGTVFGVFWDEETGELEGREVADTGRNIASFAEDQAGELYFIDYGRGGLYRMNPLAESTNEPFPQHLSETGCMDAADPSLPGPGLIPYGVNVPLWSDGAEKERWMALPDGETITVEADGHWTLPIGSVLVKQFRVGGQLVETRLLMRHDDGLWAGYTYQWDADGADATLARGGGTVATPEGDWSLPTSAECIACHTAASGQSLGMETAQMNGDFTYPNGATGNQLLTLDHVGLFASSPGEPAALPAFAGDDARAYLHVQCAHCHRPNSTAPGELDLRDTTPLADMHVCGVTPNETNVGVEDALVVAPGEPARSTLALRLRAAGADRMPPIGTVVVDESGAALVEDWIRGLQSCE